MLHILHMSSLLACVSYTNPPLLSLTWDTQAAGSHLTLAKLRQLLEDDVKNLARMGAGVDESGAVCAGAVESAANDSRGRGVCMDIQESELNAIMDRKQLFPVRTPGDGDGSMEAGAHQPLYGSYLIPREGTMYDLIDQQQTTGILSAVHYS